VKTLTAEKLLSLAILAFLLLALVTCGGGNSSSSVVTSGALSGNWQFTLTQNYPIQQNPAPIPVAGFLTETKNSLTGSLEVPILGLNSNCAGVSSATGTVSGQNVTIAINNGGNVLTLTGALASDNTSMTGTYQALGGACFTTPTTGSWTAILIPPVNGSFTGTLTGSTYMQALTGVTPPAPIVVSGTMTQSANFGASNATLTGTMTAAGYPCFTTASLSGTVSGQSIILTIFAYNGNPIGTTGNWSVAPPSASSGLGISGGTLALGSGVGASTVGPCPLIGFGGSAQASDNVSVTLTFH
jgi:hypothetical protein